MRCASTAGAALVLCAATAGLLSAQGRSAPPEPPQRYASWDEVNVLAHGLLQLGRGLREHVERTRGQLGALERRMSACGAACEEPRTSAAPPNVPASLLPGSEAAPETLRSMQVRATRGGGTRSYSCHAGLEGCGRKGHPGFPKPSCSGVKGWRVGRMEGWMNGEVAGRSPGLHQDFHTLPRLNSRLRIAGLSYSSRR